MAKVKLQGTVSATIGEGPTTVSAHDVATGNPLYFITDHNQGGADTMLVIEHGHAFALTITSSGPRGFMARLSIGTRAPGRETETAASTNTFDPAKIDFSATVVLDRWDDGGRKMIVGDGLAAIRDGVAVNMADRKSALLAVSPLLTVEAGGVVWGHSGPTFGNAEFARLAGLLERLSPGRVIAGASTDQLRALLARAEMLERELAETDDIFAIDVEAPTMARNPAIIEQALAGIGAGAGAFMGQLAQGTAAAPVAGKVMVKPVAEGAASSWRLGFLACSSAEEFARFRQIEAFGG